MRTKIFGVVAAAALLVTAAAVPVLAHHSFAAEFDAKKPDGTVEKWMVEGGAPNALLRRGWNKQSLPAGTEIKVEGFQAKDGALRANGRDITFPDGKKLFVGSSGIGAPDERPGQ